MIDALWLLLLIAAVSSASFYAGWRSASSYLNAAQAVNSVTNAVVKQANEHAESNAKVISALDNLVGSLAVLKDANGRQADAIASKLGDFEAALLTLFQGFERAGIVRSARPTPGKQVGEISPE